MGRQMHKIVFTCAIAIALVERVLKMDFFNHMETF